MTRFLSSSNSGLWLTLASCSTLAFTLACGGSSAPGDGTSGGGPAVTGGAESGGTPGSGGESGGAPPAGGAAQVGGGSQTSGGATSGGNAGASGGGSNIGGGTTTDCTFSNIQLTSAAAIPVVQQVEFATDLPGVTQAVIQFGADENYGMEAPVDLAAPSYHTLLLGLIPSAPFHYRIVAKAGDLVCSSADQTGTAGALPNGNMGNKIPTPGTSTEDPEPGFMVTSQGNWAVILNKSGALVWAMDMGTQSFSAKMSYDGKRMLARNTGPFNATGDSAGDNGAYAFVNMDGTGKGSAKLAGGDHHDFTVLPGNKIAYMAKVNQGEVDHIFLANDDGTNCEDFFDLTEVLGAFPALGGMDPSHTNAIHFDEAGQFFTVSDRERDMVVMVSMDKQVIKTIGQAPTSSLSTHILAEGAEGNGSDWRVQHGHHWYADDKFLVFSNNSSGGSAALHYTITGNTAQLDWKYAGAGTSGTQGDVEFLPITGHFLVTASNAGAIHEIDASQKLVLSYAIKSAGGGGAGGGVGYTSHRPTLYGPPPRL